MAVTELFTEETEDGESTELSVAGAATIHVSGTMGSAHVVIQTSPTGEEAWAEPRDGRLIFKDTGAEGIFLYGDIRAVVRQANADTEITVTVETP